MRRWKILAWLLCILFLFSGCSLIDKLKGNEPAPDPGTAAQTGKVDEPDEPKEPDEPETPSEPDKPQGKEKPKIIMNKPRKGDGSSDAPSADEPLPIDISMTQDFSEIEGVWREEDGSGVLTVYENGGFVLSDSSGDYFGFLVYSEEEGLWVSGPHYDMYEENNEQLFGSACLIPESDDPDMLAYVIGGGAVRYVREIPESGSNELSWVYVEWGDNDQATFMQSDEVVVNTDEPQAKLLFFTYGDVRDFRFLSLTAGEVSEEGEITFYYEVLYERERLEPGLALYVTTCFYGDIPNNGISFVDDMGRERFFAVDISGEDGSVYLWELE